MYIKMMYIMFITNSTFISGTLMHWMSIYKNWKTNRLRYLEKTAHRSSIFRYMYQVLIIVNFSGYRFTDIPFFFFLPTYLFFLKTFIQNRLQVFKIYIFPSLIYRMPNQQSFATGRNWCFTKQWMQGENDP